MTELDARLNTARHIYAGATRRAARAWALLAQLHAKRLHLDTVEALDRVAAAIYYSNRYNASEQYDSIEEFKESLKEDLDGALVTEALDGKPYYVVAPFFAEQADYHHQLGLSYLRGCSLQDLAGLNVKALVAEERTTVSGLSEGEMEVLISSYHRRTLTLVNLMRKACTAMCYIQTGLTNEHNSAPGYPDAVKDADIPSIAEELARVLALPFEPTPATHFGTEADARNVLRDLPEALAADCLLKEP